MRVSTTHRVLLLLAALIAGTVAMALNNESGVWRLKKVKCRLWGSSISPSSEETIEARVVSALQQARKIIVTEYARPKVPRHVRVINKPSSISRLARAFSIERQSKAAILLGTEESTMVNIDGADELDIIGGRLYFPAPTPHGLSVRIGPQFLEVLAEESANRDDG